MNPTNQNREGNIVRYHIASNPPYDRSTVNFVQQFKDTIKAYAYDYNPESILAEARKRMDKKKQPGTEAYFDLNGDISIIIETAKFHL